MKRLLLLFCMILMGSSVYSQMQEVRGVETQKVIYSGDEYNYYIGYTRHTSNDYYGFEFINKNSISVSVSIEVYQRGMDEDKIVATKEVVLKSSESYVLKEPTLYKICMKDGALSCMVSGYDSDEKGGKEHAEQFYVKYKAYKLL